MAQCPVCDKHAGLADGDEPGAGDSCTILMSAYILAGFAMMLNIRLCYSSAPYALIRFKLPENLFSVFVRRMASSLELWCLPGFIIADIMDLGLKGYYYHNDYKKWTDDKYKPRQGGNIYKSNNNGTTPEGNSLQDARELKFHWIIIPSIVAQWLNFLTYVILFFVYRGGGDQGHLTRFYWIIAVSGFVFGMSNPLVFAVDYNYLAIYIAGENCFPALTSSIHYLTTLMFGNRRKWNSDYLIVYIDIVVAIIISFVAAVLWTVGYGVLTKTKDGKEYGHIFTVGFEETPPKASTVAPLLIVLVGMGLVYAIYPGIAPGMIVPFHLIDKIEMVLLIATIVPALGVAMVNKFNYLSSPKCYKGWDDELAFYHVFDLVVPIMIILAYLFIYSLHYRDSGLSRAIVNQPKMSTTLTIIFYMCSEISLAVGFAGMVGNAPEYTVIAQMVGAFLMVFLALYSEGYIIEYKSHDPVHWRSEGMWYLYGYYQLNHDFFIMIKFNVCSDGYCYFK